MYNILIFSMGETGGVGSTFYFYIPMINKSLQSIVTTISINLSTNLLVQMRAIYVHFHMWERNNEWSYTIIYANREIYEFTWRREEVNSYTPRHPCTRSVKLMNWCHDAPATICQRYELARDSVHALSSDKASGGMYERLFQQCLKGVIRRRQEPNFCIIRLILLYLSPTKTIRVPLLESFYFTVNDASATIWQLHRAQTVDSIALEPRTHTHNSIIVDVWRCEFFRGIGWCYCRWFSNRLFVSIQLTISMSITLSHNSEGGESWR